MQCPNCGHDVPLTFIVNTPPPGFQLNGHRTDCRCTTCRPDICRLPASAAGDYPAPMYTVPLTTTGVGTGVTARWPERGED